MRTYHEGMTSPFRSAWNAPAASPPPPGRVWRDWVLVGVLAALVVLEGVLRTDVPWRWLWVAVLVALVPTLLWRRSLPLPMLAIAFGVGAVVTVVTGGDPQLVATAYLLILVYAVVRWGSGRAMVLAGALVLASTALSFAIEPASIPDVIGGMAVLATTISLGAAVRARAGARARELERMKLLEREQLARELHDTVAHHVSAIAIQAQAGTAVAPTDPAAAARALRVIEEEASRTLVEMRAIVRTLRREDAPDPAPGPGIAELRALAKAHADANSHADAPVVDVRLSGDIDGLPAAVAATAYRLVQEAVTNARRHARNATRVDVRVEAGTAEVRVEVRDDGDAVASAPPGYGITGMIERAKLLGGTCRAAPGADGGWIVAAVLPRGGGSG